MGKTQQRDAATRRCNKYGRNQKAFVAIAADVQTADSMS